MNFFIIFKRGTDKQADRNVKLLFFGHIISNEIAPQTRKDSGANSSILKMYRSVFLSILHYIHYKLCRPLFQKKNFFIRAYIENP